MRSKGERALSWSSVRPPPQALSPPKPTFPFGKHEGKTMTVDLGDTDRRLRRAWLGAGGREKPPPPQPKKQPPPALSRARARGDEDRLAISGGEPL
jgi:hypothetical protein